MNRTTKGYTMNALCRHRYWLGLVIAVALTLAPCTAALAAPDNDAADVAPPTVEVTLEKKTRQVVITNVGDRYAVSKQETTIVGPDGKQVEYPDLLVPCDVTVTYHMENGARKADLITITRISSSAKRDFFSERPE